MHILRRPTGPHHRQRKGAIVVLAAAMLVVAFGFAAFTIDFGMVTLTKAQIQNAADSSSHAAVMEVARSFGPGYEITQDEAEEAARTRAVEMVGRFRSGDVVATVADITRDVRVGRRSWNDLSGTWDEEWGMTPYNMVEVTVRRTQAGRLRPADELCFRYRTGFVRHRSHICLHPVSVLRVLSPDGFQRNHRHSAHCPRPGKLD